MAKLNERNIEIGFKLNWRKQAIISNRKK